MQEGDDSGGAVLGAIIVAIIAMIAACAIVELSHGG